MIDNGWKGGHVPKKWPNKALSHNSPIVMLANKGINQL